MIRSQVYADGPIEEYPHISRIDGSGPSYELPSTGEIKAVFLVRWGSEHIAYAAEGNPLSPVDMGKAEGDMIEFIQDHECDWVSGTLVGLFVKVG